MVARHRRDPVGPSLRATDATVPVVVPRGDRLGNRSRGRGRRWHRATRERDQLRRGAAGQHLVQRVRFTLVDGEPIPLPDRDHPRREPAAVLRRQPLGRVEGHLLVAIHARGPANVRFSRSLAKRRRVAGSAANRPLSCASERATMCPAVIVSTWFALSAKSPAPRARQPSPPPLGCPAGAPWRRPTSCLRQSVDAPVVRFRARRARWARGCAAGRPR